MSKSKLLNVRINPDFKKRAKELAKSDGRSLSNWVIKLIAQEIEKADKKGKVESK
jgi:predicted HicB family RNase H-like nuclease